MSERSIDGIGELPTTYTTEIQMGWEPGTAWEGLRRLTFDKGDQVEVALGDGRSMLARVKSVTEGPSGVFDVVLEEVLDDERHADTTPMTHGA